MTPELGAPTRADTPHTCITTVSVRSAHELDRSRSPVPARNGHVLVARRHLVRGRCAVALGPRYGGAFPGRSLVEFVGALATGVLATGVLAMPRPLGRWPGPAFPNDP